MKMITLSFVLELQGCIANTCPGIPHILKDSRDCSDQTTGNTLQLGRQHSFVISLELECFRLQPKLMHISSEVSQPQSLIICQMHIVFHSPHLVLVNTHLQLSWCFHF